MEIKLRQITWITSSLNDLKSFPRTVQKDIGFAFRAVYAVKLGEDIYVLHAFQKKSKKGIKTPKQEIDLIKRRLNLAKEDAKQRRGQYE